MTSAFPHSSLISPYFANPSISSANAAASRIGAWSAYASQPLGAMPESGLYSPAIMDGDMYLCHSRDDVSSPKNSGALASNNEKELPTCFAPSSAISRRESEYVDDGDNAAKLQQMLTNLKIRCHTDGYENLSPCSSPDISLEAIRDPSSSVHQSMHSHAKNSSPLSLSTQSRSLYAYNRQVYDATRSLYGTQQASPCPTQIPRQYAAAGERAPFLAGTQTFGYSNDVSDDYSQDFLSPHMVSSLENLVSSPIPRLAQGFYEQPHKRHVNLPSSQPDGTPYTCLLSQNKLNNFLPMSEGINPLQISYHGVAQSSSSDSSSSSLLSDASDLGTQTAATVTHGNNLAVWGFDDHSYLIDPHDGRQYGIAEEILAQQHPYLVSRAPPNPDRIEGIPVHYNQPSQTTGPFTEAMHFALNMQKSSSATFSPLPARRGSFDGDFSILNASQSAVVGGPSQAGGNSYAQNPHQRRASVSSNPPMSALSTSISGAAAKDPKKISLYKTELCRSFEETGSCRYGSKCQFAHGQEELRTVERHPKHKSVMCKTFWEQGSCPYGQRCCFIHTAVPSDRGTVSIQSRTQFQSASPPGASHSLPAKPNTGASTTISTDDHKQQTSGSLSSLYPADDDAVINAINVDTSKLAKGSTASTLPCGPVTMKSATSVHPDNTPGVTATGTSNMERRLRRASLSDAEDTRASGLVPPLKGKQSQCTCSKLGGAGSCFLCSANGGSNVASSHSHLRSRTIPGSDFAYPQQPAYKSARRSSLTESGTRRLPIFQNMQG